MHLGTLVEISIKVENPALALTILSSAFAEVASIHQLMSFHLSTSDVSNLNRDAATHPVQVDRRTVGVIRAACDLSRASNGHFDITVAANLVESGRLPAPPLACTPSSAASWQDIEIISEDSVFFHKPLWIDLGGIAKGYAVDMAFAKCMSYDCVYCLVNAGGDLRLSDGSTSPVVLNVPGHSVDTVPCVELTGGAIASSCGQPATGTSVNGCHFDGVSRARVDPHRFVSVMSETCMLADALTKVVLVLGEAAGPILSSYNAVALLYDRGGEWLQIPA